MTRREHLDLLADQIDAVIRELREGNAANAATANTLRDTSVPLRDLIDALDRSYEANRQAFLRNERAIVAGLSASAAVIALLRENGGQA